MRPLLPSRSITQNAINSAARIPRKIQLSIHDQSVPVKSMQTSSCASTPVAITARKGRAPDVVARPAPWPMSVNALMRRSGAVGTLRSGMTLPPTRSTARDIERYAGLFAARTRVMKSSAMRDMMAVTARPEVISLAGGLPDTSTFPPETFAALMDGIARESCASALQYGPTEGFDATRNCISEVMAAEGMKASADDMIVTTGGQQVIDLVTKTLVDPGDVV